MDVDVGSISFFTLPRLPPHPDFWSSLHGDECLRRLGSRENRSPARERTYRVSAAGDPFLRSLVALALDGRYCVKEGDGDDGLFSEPNTTAPYFMPQ